MSDTARVPLVSATVHPHVTAGVIVWRWGAGIALLWRIERLFAAFVHEQPGRRIWELRLGPLAFSAFRINTDFGRGYQVLSVSAVVSTYRRIAELGFAPFRWHRPWIKQLPAGTGIWHRRIYAGPFWLRLFNGGRP